MKVLKNSFLLVDTFQEKEQTHTHTQVFHHVSLLTSCFPSSFPNCIKNHPTLMGECTDRDGECEAVCFWETCIRNKSDPSREFFQYRFEVGWIGWIGLVDNWISWIGLVGMH